MRTLCQLVAVIALTTMAGACGDDQSPSAADPTSTGQDGCQVTHNRPGHEVESSAHQQAQRAVADVLETEFPAGPKAGIPIEQGLLGTAYDAAAEEIVVLIDPAVVNSDQLRSRLEEAVGSDGRVRVQGGCASADELSQAMNTVRSEASALGAHGWHLDAYDSKIHVTFHESDRDDAKSLADRTDGHVVIDFVEGESVVDARS
jgi:hypothetical protein